MTKNEQLKLELLKRKHLLAEQNLILHKALRLAGECTDKQLNQAKRKYNNACSAINRFRKKAERERIERNKRIAFERSKSEHKNWAWRP